MNIDVVLDESMTVEIKRLMFHEFSISPGSFGWRVQGILHVHFLALREED